jgi:hypothetical protein
LLQTKVGQHGQLSATNQNFIFGQHKTNVSETSKT